MDIQIIDIDSIEKSQAEILQLKSIIDDLPGDIYWKDLQGVYLGMNANGVRSLNRMGFNLAITDIIGKTDYDLFGAETAEIYRKNDLEILSTGNKQSKEEAVILSSGEKVIQLSIKQPLRDVNGKIIGIVGNTVDISHLKKIEADLIVTKEQAESASRTKSEFIANMSHSIRTPLAGILGMTQDMLNAVDEVGSSLQQSYFQKNSFNNDHLALMDKLIKIVHQDSQMLMGAADELLNLFNEILEMVRLESGKPSEDTESFNLRELIEHNIELLLPVAMHKKLDLKYAIDQNVPAYLHGFRNYLNRSLLNLIGNALKFTETGWVNVSVKLLSSTNYYLGDTIKLEIIVEDTGIGIPKDKIKVIFEHFSRLTSSYQGIYKGAGLGLYTVQQYVSVMNGEAIRVESEFGKGSRFILRLPFVVSDHSDRIRPSYRALAMKVAKPVTFLPERVDHPQAIASILLVEDSPIVAMGAMANLKNFDCSIDVATTGYEAIKMAESGKYNLIFMDIGLPDISGNEVARKIRDLANPAAAQIPIIALTGHACDAEKRQEALEAGMQAVLNKPASPSELKLILDQYVLNKCQQVSALDFSAINADSPVLANSKEVINWEESLNRWNNDKVFVDQLLNSMAEDLKLTKERLETCYKEKNMEAIGAELHRVRGALHFIKLPQLEKAVVQFQNILKEKTLNSMQMKKAYVKIQKTIDTFWEARK